MVPASKKRKKKKYNSAAFDSVLLPLVPLPGLKSGFTRMAGRLLEDFTDFPDHFIRFRTLGLITMRLIHDSDYRQIEVLN